MKKLYVYFSVVSLFLFAIALHAQIGAKVQQQNKVTGLWQNSQFGYQMTLMLNADGRGEFDGEVITYTVQSNKLAIKSEAQPMTTYTYSLQGNALTLSGGDLEGAVTFTRAGASTDEVKPTAKPLVTPSYTSVMNTTNHDKNLVGVWSGNGETFEFKENGTAIYLGNTLQYEVSPGQITLSTTQGKVVFAYTINANQLTLTVNGQQVIYIRGTGNASTQSNTGNGNVAMELVGKWCYVNVTSTNTGGSSTDECITLQADGSYVYYSERSMSVNTNDFAGGTNSQDNDRGTWYVQGDRIFYNSQSQGQGSYRLEKRNHPKNVNDPMIVLDGRAYVTATYRQPWR